MKMVGQGCEPKNVNLLGSIEGNGFLKGTI